MSLLCAASASVTGLDTDVERVLDLGGILVFAISGGLTAVRKEYDVVGVVALSLVTALGGGILRDLLLGDTPPVALRDTNYLV
ncbi:MAG TPA: TRIC cation channel family protein, partial [Ilumatobacteraceae bacterium]|nr:TRIC cation channel family protein [Ilumatobacteraceae bacterium]